MTRVVTTTPRLRLDGVTPRTALIVLGIILSGQAFGFDVDGYRSGMSLAEVQRRAGKLDRISGSYVVMTPSGPFGPSFTFCDDKLFMYGVSLDGGFPTFSRVVERETARLGRGAYSVANHEGRSNQLTIYWQDGDASMSVTLLAHGTNPGLLVSQAWNAQEAVCQPLKR